MTGSQSGVAETLRQRIVSLMRAGALRPGDRLPSSRELSAEFGTDRRVVQAAYRLLASDGLVEQRERSGVFLRKQSVAVDRAGISAVWLTELFANALGRDIPAPQLPDLLKRAMASCPLRAVTVATTIDQNEWMCRELRDDYGLQATSISSEVISAGAPWPRALTEAHLIVTTAGLLPQVGKVANELGIRFIAGQVRSDLIGPAWRRLLLDGAAYVVVADSRFIAIMQQYFRSVPAGANIRYLVAGADDLGHIPRMAPVYITSAARDRLGRIRVPGRPIGSERAFTPETAKEILRFVVGKQLEAAMLLD